MFLEKCTAIFFLVAILLINILVIVAGSVVLTDGQNLASSPDIPIYGYSWANNLVTWSIVSISISVFQTFFLIGYCLLNCFKFFDEERQGNAAQGVYGIVQIILILLAIVSMIIPQIDQYPNQYKATTFLFCSLLMFVLLYGGILFMVVYSLIVGQSEDDDTEDQENPPTTTPAITSIMPEKV